MLINSGGKFTDVKRSLIKMLQSYKSIRNLIQKLTNKSPKYLNDIDLLIKEVKDVRRVSQREIKHYAELQMINEVEAMLKNYVFKNSDNKIRRFDIYSHVSCYLDVLASKIGLLMPKNVVICVQTPEMMKWKLFLSEITQNKEFLYAWLKTYSGHNNAETQSFEKSKSVYKFSTCLTLTKAQTPTTTNYSCSQSLAGQLVEFEPKAETKRHSFLKRCQTANPKSKTSHKANYPINVRSPSAKEYIKTSHEKQSVHQRKLTRRAVKTKTFFKSDAEPCQFDGTMEIVQIRQNNSEINKLIPKPKEKDRIQKKQVYEFTAKQVFPPQEKAQAAPPIIEEKIFESMHHHKPTDVKSQRRSSMRKIKNYTQTQVVKSSFGKENQLQFDQSPSTPSKNDESQSVFEDVNSSEGERKKQDTKRWRNPANSSDNEQNTQQMQKQKIQAVELGDQNIEKKRFSKNRKESMPRKLQTRPSFEIDSPKFERKGKRTHRRMGMISSKEIVSALKRIHTKQNEEEKEKELQLKKKAIEFNTKLIAEKLNLDDDLSQVEYENEIALHPVTCSKVHEFYLELARMKKDQVKLASEAKFGNESIFFIQQDLLREEKSRELQSYLRKIKSRHTSIGEVFDIRSQEISNKVESYMVVERKFAFEADSEWIKQNFKCNQIRDSQDEPELVQQESRESWSVKVMEEI